ncbi:MAG: response regulator [Candidatus Eisenbacteria bacterium]|uniref:Response regulator n=1 Tax=Eiseniibacteriota bacterium TaxID=2212470 RepID=A0A948W7X6_UNCEI|nr:response regulator [Candidatus Eisenbacteria bacterium]MBU1949148.1 response regulator [Candidatus Eisenbacteria bacterium]MBU2692111.1 response regulator [Candidatus Eisenbacteria bacterium]
MAKILVVDDSSFQRKKVGRLLERIGFEICEAEDGLGALRAVEETKFDLVITDLNMPKMDGLEFLERLREGEHDLPVIVLTSDVQESTRELCLEFGAAEFLNKPIVADRLRLAVESFLGPQGEAAA